MTFRVVFFQHDIPSYQFSGACRAFVSNWHSSMFLLVWRSEPSLSLLSLTFRVAFSVSVFKAVIISQLDVHSHLADFDIETPPPFYDCCFWWIIELLTPWVQSSQHTWFDLDTHFPLLHTHTSYIWHHYTCIHLVRASHLLSPHISSPYMTLSHSLDQVRMQTNLEFSGRVFTCLWTLGSTSSMMVGPFRLFIRLNILTCLHFGLRVLVSFCLVFCFSFALLA